MITQEKLQRLTKILEQERAQRRQAKAEQQDEQRQKLETRMRLMLSA
jgi:hypothetical protein